MAARDRYTSQINCQNCGQQGILHISEDDHSYMRDTNRKIDEIEGNFHASLKDNFAIQVTCKNCNATFLETLRYCSSCNRIGNSVAVRIRGLKRYCQFCFNYASVFPALLLSFVTFSRTMWRFLKQFLCAFCFRSAFRRHEPAQPQGSPALSHRRGTDRGSYLPGLAMRPPNPSFQSGRLG